MKEGAPFDPVSREGALVANNLFLSVILGIVLVGTLYPLIAEAATGEKLSVGPPYFNATAGPLALILAALMMIGPQLRWRRDRVAILPRLAPGVVVALATLGRDVPARARHQPARAARARAAAPGSSRPASRRCSAARCAAPRSPSGGCASRISASPWR